MKDVTFPRNRYPALPLAGPCSCGVPQVGCLDSAIGGDLFRGSLGENSTLIENCDAVRQVEDHPHVVLNQYDRKSLISMEPADEMGDRIGLLVAHACCRFVKEKEMRADSEGHGDFGRSLVSVREFANLPDRLFLQGPRA